MKHSDAERDKPQLVKKQELLAFLAALWLLAVVVVRVFLDLSQTSTPMREWSAKMFRLLGL